MTSCSDCGLCEAVCPCAHKDENSTPLARTYAAANVDLDERMHSSSGGVFIQLARETIDGGGVVFGAAFDEKWEVHHVAAETMDEVESLMGSKYVQSRIGETFKEAETALKAGRKVLFTGTSCQIKGLLSYLRRPYENLLAVDVICHGAPSPGVWRRYVEEIEAKAAQRAAAGKNTVLSVSNGGIPAIAGIAFRDKYESGWKKYCFVVRTSASQADRNSVLQSDIHYENPFMRGFLANIYLRPSCYDCRAKGGKSGADITLADFWGIDELLPEWDDDHGTSLVVVHTAKGEAAFDSIGAKRQEVSPEDAFRRNVSYHTSVAAPPARAPFFEGLSQGHSVTALVRRAFYVPLYKRIIPFAIRKSKALARKLLRR